MNWLRRLTTGYTQTGLEERTAILNVLQRLYLENAEYIAINHLGRVHHNRSMQQARDVLAIAGRQTWYEAPEGCKEQ